MEWKESFLRRVRWGTVWFFSPEEGLSIAPSQLKGSLEPLLSHMAHFLLIVVQKMELLTLVNQFISLKISWQSKLLLEKGRSLLKISLIYGGVEILLRFLRNINCWVCKNKRVFCLICQLFIYNSSKIIKFWNRELWRDSSCLWHPAPPTGKRVGSLTDLTGRGAFCQRKCSWEQKRVGRVRRV